MFKLEACVEIHGESQEAVNDIGVVVDLLVHLCSEWEMESKWRVDRKGK